jgi:hypothetical protein
MNTYFLCYLISFCTFLAYFQFLKSAIVRLSVYVATTFRRVDRSCSIMAQSIAYDSEISTKEGNFLGPILDPAVGV